MKTNLKLDDLLTKCWDNNIKIYPVHLRGDRFSVNIELDKIIHKDKNIYTQRESKKQVLKYYKYYYNLIKKK